MSTNVFVETSALLSFLFNEEGRAEVQAKLSSATRIIGSRLLKLETKRAIHRLRHFSKTEEQIILEIERAALSLWPKFDFVEITKDICDKAESIHTENNLRSLDAIHLASFYFLKTQIKNIYILTFDKRIREVLPNV